MFHIIMQQLLPSSTPYSILDYGVTAIVLVVMGIVLYFTFKTLAKILADHAIAMHEISATLRVMRENQLTLITDTRFLHEGILSLRKEEADHRLEQAEHIVQQKYRDRNKPM